MRDTVCGLTVSPRQGGHHPAHLAGGDAAQKCFPDHQRHLFGPALELVHYLRQKSPLAAAGNAQTQHSEAGHETPPVISVAIISPLLRPLVAPAHHVQVALPLAQLLKKLLRRLLHASLQIAPETLLQLRYKMLEMLGDRCYFRHGCRSPFRNGFSLRGQSQLTPSSFLHNRIYVTPRRS
jgi:hypothetical protein